MPHDIAGYLRIAAHMHRPAQAQCIDNFYIRCLGKTKEAVNISVVGNRDAREISRISSDAQTPYTKSFKQLNQGNI